MNNIQDTSNYACSGCGACNTVCPVNAISVRLNERGFFTASVDSDKCIECGFCKKVCTRYDEKLDGTDIRKTPLSALQSRNKSVVRHSSSGGIAYELARQALTENKKVVGVYYDLVSDRAKHLVIESEDQLSKLAGSKYIQSDPNIFKDIVQDAKKTRSEYVVFGTPCQIAGLSKVVDILNIRDQFLFVEVFCHGVPPYALWDHEYGKLKKKWNVSQFDDVQFRYKKDDWHSYCLRIKAKNKTYYGKRETSLFWQVFFENILLNDSCYDCRMRKQISSADIRLGDYWGTRFQERTDGVSAAFSCTARGEAAIQELQVYQFESGNSEEMLKAQNMDGYHDQKLHEESMTVLQTQGIVPAVKYYRKRLSLKQKVKRHLLQLSSVIPTKIRNSLRKKYRNLLLRK